MVQSLTGASLPGPRMPVKASSEQPPGKVFTCCLKMSGDFAENRGEGADSHRVVARDCDVMLPPTGCGEAHVAAGLAGHFVTEGLHRLCQVVASHIAG